jgi:tetratricopeptide (TPR) repeat protein/tRNA A-37 threonylcarbamoyl transferase component Bud32/Arc/MetJ-type ribon-helix-helix transcriptional regulator
MLNPYYAMEGNVANLIGKELGKYRVTERIGRGGMAEVYLGVHTMLDRPVAIKVLHGYLTEDVSFIERFKREAKAVANLRHPNIVQLYDFDVYEDMLFMVMEYIDGINLHQRLVEVGKRGERLPIKQVGSIINDIASALDYAHTQGMLHRDVKPSNILLDSQGKAYLTDFGIAKFVSGQRLTATGTMLGTPAYMSPEQGRGEELTEESDIYSLGIVAFEMLTGRVPYDARTPIAIVQKQITAPVPAISSLVDDVPPNTQEVIDRALAKSPDGRYSSASELVIALRIALRALESSQAVTMETVLDAAAKEKASAPTIAPASAIGAGENTLAAETVAMEEDEPVEVPEQETDAATAVMEDIEESDLDKVTVTMEEPELDNATVAMESDEIPPLQKTTKVAEKKSPASKPGKKKMPLWAWIAIGAVVLGGAAFAVTQLLPGREAAETPAAEVVVEDPTPKPQPEEPAPEPEPEELVEEVAFLQEPGVVVFDAENMDGGLILRLNEDVDVEMVTAGENQETAWRTGNGQVLSDVDGNGMEDFFIMFDVDNDFLYEAPDPGLQVQFEVDYLDEGTDSFQLEYDAHSGGAFGDGRYKVAEVIQKTNSGEFKTAVFYLDDVLFGNRLGPVDGPGDFRIFDLHDGAETFRRVTLRVPAAGQAFVKGDYAQQTGDFERAIRFYEHAMHAGFEDAAWGHKMLGLMYREVGNYEGCIANLNSFFDYGRDDIDAFLWRGDCFAAVGDSVSAAMSYQEFLARAEGDPNWDEDRERVQAWMDEANDVVKIAAEIGEVLFDIHQQDGGLEIMSGGDADIDLILAGNPEEYAWRSGNGEVLADYGNDIEDWYMKFAIGDDLIYEYPDGQTAIIIVEYLDVGTDSFYIEYDAHSGGPEGDGSFKPSDLEVRKTNSGEFRDAVFVLTDARFANRIQGGDFRINDKLDGAETIRRVIIRTANAEQDMNHADMLRHEGNSEDAIHYYTLAIDAGFENQALVYNMRGLMYRDTEQWELCIDDYTVFYELDPENPWASLERGDCYAGLENIAMARQDYERFMALTEGDPTFGIQQETVQEWLGQHP